MAIWQHDITGERFDDGLALRPGDEGFTREVAEKNFGSKKFSYIGTPNWVAPQPPVADEPEQPAEPTT